MGIDLKLLASSFRERPDQVLSTAAIRLEREARLLSQLTMESDPRLVRPMPEGLKVGHYEDAGLRYDDMDRYGALLRLPPRNN